MSYSRFTRPLGPWLLGLIIFLGAFASASTAQAYPWMIRHDYTGCATCHTDPSGAGVLTPYGRAQSALLLSTRFAGSESDEPGKLSEAFFGVIPQPDWLLLQGWVRNGYIWNNVDGKLVDHRLLQMRADLGAHVALGAFRAAATVGWNRADSVTFAQQAWVTGSSSAGNVVSREHWAGASLADDTVLVRAGRMNLPFGLRNIEHTSWVRSETRTDTNQGQEHGVALAYGKDSFRGEIMAIAGNFQVHPDAYRERGYAAYAEIALAPRYTLGVSSLLAHAAADIGTLRATTRQAHGVFTRWAPVTSLVLLGEINALITSVESTGTRAGYVGLVQADLEPIQGLHAIATGELLARGGEGDGTRTGLWLGAAWFVVAHVDMRVDAIRRTDPRGPSTMTYLAQLHLYL